MPAGVPMLTRIKALNPARGGGIAVQKTGRGCSPPIERIGGLVARLKPIRQAGKVQVLW